MKRGQRCGIWSVFVVESAVHCVESCRGQHGSASSVLSRWRELVLDIRSAIASSTATINASHLGFTSALCAVSVLVINGVDRLTWRLILRRRCDGPRCLFLCLLMYCVSWSSGVDGDDHGVVSSAVSARSHVGLFVVFSTVHVRRFVVDRSSRLARDPLLLLSSSVGGGCRLY